MREAFEKQIAANKYDGDCRKVFADYLEENGFDDEAAWQRAWTPEWQHAHERMMSASEEYMNYARTTEQGYEMLLLEAQEGHVTFWGSSEAREEFLAEYPEFFDDVQLLSGVQFDEERRENVSFSCSC